MEMYGVAERQGVRRCREPSRLLGILVWPLSSHRPESEVNQMPRMRGSASALPFVGLAILVAEPATITGVGR